MSIFTIPFELLHEILENKSISPYFIRLERNGWDMKERFSLKRYFIRDDGPVGIFACLRCIWFPVPLWSMAVPSRGGGGEAVAPP